MSSSPILRRLSTSTTASTDPREDLINAYEAEEERIINVLSRKLEQLREEKISLENALEAESESHVNRLSRELSLLRARQRVADDLEAPAPQSSQSMDPRFPTAEAMLDAIKKENESLRNRLVDTERDYVRVSRLNEVYREELIEHRRRLGLSVDSLVGLAGSAADPYSQPLHRRSTSHSPNTSISYVPRPMLSGLPIPRPSSQLHRTDSSHAAEDDCSATTPLSNSPSSSPCPYPFAFSPLTNNPASYVSNATHVTTPSSASLHSTPPAPFPTQSSMSLSYPSVPPPSLSSSLGSPVPSISHSPTEARGSRNSRPCARVAEVGNLRDLSRSRSRQGSNAQSQSGSPLSGTSILPHSPPPPSSNTSIFQQNQNQNGNGEPQHLSRSHSRHRIAETGSLSRRNGAHPTRGD